MKSNRLEVVDALRGFALLAILLLHNLEHYNIYYTPSEVPVWLTKIDSCLSGVLWFMLAGKAYATFSLLFGFSFYIQRRNARSRGCDFRIRFAWRMLILIGFSQLHALFYNGDILLLYAICGLILIPASAWSNRTVLIVAVVLICQPLELAHIIYAWFNDAYINLNDNFVKYAESAYAIDTTGGLWDTLKNNITDGQLYSNLWQIDAGRLCLTPGLFLFGLWLGRKELFIKTERNYMFWSRALSWSIIAVIPLYLITEHIPLLTTNATLRSHSSIMFSRIYDYAFMMMLVSFFVICWFKSKQSNGFRFQRGLIVYGRMSLTNYIMQSIIGVVVYYNFGLGLYKYTGSTACVLIGIAIFAVQWIFSKYWLLTHKQGPFEYIWKRLTWLSYSDETSIKIIKGR